MDTEKIGEITKTVFDAVKKSGTLSDDATFELQGKVQSVPCVVFTVKLDNDEKKIILPAGKFEDYDVAHLLADVSEQLVMIRFGFKDRRRQGNG